MIGALLSPLAESHVTDLGNGSRTPSTIERTGEYV